MGLFMRLLKTVHMRRSDEQHDSCKKSEKEREPGKDYGDSHYPKYWLALKYEQYKNHLQYWIRL